MKEAQKAAAAVCFLACGAMVVASFMPWISFGGGGAVSGWDLVDHQRDAGANLFVVWNFMTASDGSTVPFLTGLVTLLSGLWVAAWAAAVVIVRLARGDEGVPRLLAVVAFLAVMAGAVGGLENIYFYNRGADASGASLEAGLLIVWAASLVAVIAYLVVQAGALAHRHGSAAHPSPS